MERIGRREFLAGSLVGASGLLLKSKLAIAADSVAEPNLAKAPVKMFDPWEVVSLGKTGIKVTRVGCGTGMHGGRHSSNQTRLGKEKFEGLLKEAYDRGCRLFDCADMYGSHPYIIPALKGISRDKFTIVSKLMVWDPPAEEKEKPLVTIDRFLKELNTDYIDLLLLHCMMAPDWNKTLKPYMDGMSEAKAKGKVRALGVSCHSMDALKVAAEEPWVESVHTRINATGTDMDGSPEEVVPIIRKIHDAGKGVVGMKLIGQGEFRDDRKLREQSADFVFNLGCVDAVVVGFESINEVKDYEDIVKKTVRKIA
ncbi:MAG: aldo/keto reductase [Sedimentisphaerales bacterium]|jgi:aryl-alcohol dehydrogenase-like predicted oxidoreductase